MATESTRSANSSSAQHGAAVGRLEANLSRVRADALRAEAPSAIVVVMRAHAQETQVVYCGCVALMALCNGEGAPEAKRQAVSAGVLPLLAAMLQKSALPYQLWVMGRHTLKAIVRDEPQLRKQARACLPRWGSTPSKLPKYRHLSCARPCPGGARRIRSYHSIAIYRALTLARVGLDALEATKVASYRFPLLPRWSSTPSK